MELITLAQIQQYKGITGNVDVSKQLRPYILEAQDLDLRIFLGDEFYIDLLDDYDASPSLVKYSDLYNGVDYTYSTYKYRCDGIVPLLVNFAYARYLSMANIHSTPYGLMRKTSENSEAITDQQQARIIAQAKSQAIVYQERVKNYLDRNYTLYPLWRCCSNNRRQGSIKIYGVGGNSK